MAIAVDISYRIDVSHRSLTAYRFHARPGSNEPASGRLKQTGPTFNNVVSYRGTFANEDDAVNAVLEFVPAPLAIWERPETLGPGGPVTWMLKKPDFKPQDGPPYHSLVCRRWHAKSVFRRTV